MSAATVSDHIENLGAILGMSGERAGALGADELQAIAQARGMKASALLRQAEEMSANA